MDASDHTSLKKCSKCCEVFPATTEYFHRHGKHLSSPCKACGRKEALKRYHADPDAKDRQRIRAANRYWSPETHDNELAQKRTDYLKHREERLEKAKAYGRVNRDAKNISRRKWRKNNPDKQRAMSVRAKTARRNREAGGTITAAEISAQRLAQTDKRGALRCWWCGKRINREYHIDHKQPLSRGGLNEAANIVIAHPKCNLQKGAKLFGEWIGRLL